VNGANCADCETTWPEPSLLASRMAISGAPRPLLLDGPGWSSPGHVHALFRREVVRSRQRDGGGLTTNVGPVMPIVGSCTLPQMRSSGEQRLGRICP
jgi:hypothetical protein